MLAGLDEEDVVLETQMCGGMQASVNERRPYGNVPNVTRQGSCGCKQLTIEDMGVPIEVRIS